MPASFDLILKNGKCFIDGQLKAIDIGISSGIIKSIGKIEKTNNEKILELLVITSPYMHAFQKYKFSFVNYLRKISKLAL